MKTINEILAIRKHIAKYITSPFCDKNRSHYVTFLDDTDEVERLYLSGVAKIFEQYSERDENGILILENNFFVVLPENQSKVMEDVSKLKSTEIHSQKITDSFNALNFVINEQ